MSNTPASTDPARGGARPVEMEAVRTTIVGGRPPGSGRRWGPIPRGIEILVKKASVDPEFRRLLLDVRAEAAGAIGLALDRAEAAMLAAIPDTQLDMIIARATVPVESRAAFLGRAAALMLAALGAETFAVAEPESRLHAPPAPMSTPGIAPTPGARDAATSSGAAACTQPATRADDKATTSFGISPTPTPPPTRGIQPTPPPPVGGIRPASVDRRKWTQYK
jgi:hypothetical protein